MNSRYESFFSYNITRPFPFKWLTPVAIIGGIALFVSITILNFAANGYVLTVEISTDPNVTISQSLKSIQHWPSYLTSRIRPSCQTTSLPVNTEFFTNQTALLYTLTDVWREEPQRTVLPALPYHANVLEQCTVNSIQIDVESQDRAANQLALTEWGARVRLWVTCQVSIDMGLVFINLTQSYDYVPDTVSFAQIRTFLGSGIQSRDKSTRASLWWGESLMSTYWMQIAMRLQNETRNRDEYHIRKGSLYFVPRPDRGIQNSDFFTDFQAQFIKATEPGHPEYPHAVGDQTIEDLIHNETYPNIWAPGDNLAKSAYATVLVDLGQNLAEPTMLTDATLLRDFTSNLVSTQAQTTNANAYPGPARKSYDETDTDTGPLSVTPSVISAQYYCQVPHLRSPGSLVMSILVADLVILQTAWQLYMLLCGYILTRRYPNSQCCNGCLKELPHTDAIPVMQKKTLNSKYGQVLQHDVEIETPSEDA